MKWSSFRDACLGREGTFAANSRKDLVAEKLGKLEFQDVVQANFRPTSSSPDQEPMVTMPSKSSSGQECNNVAIDKGVAVGQTQEEKKCQSGKERILRDKGINLGDSISLIIMNETVNLDENLQVDNLINANVEESMAGDWMAISIKVSRGRSSWFITAIYASLVPAGRLLLWDYFVDLRGSISNP
ncbi:hypothetical protein RIF29_38865 [Crotalaria pallida]|uniref:Uncharacterized protein n=1 Tax=Crotalaria pallida TaxID=3830 RepID=A0AAN9E2L2_CROPI